MKVISRKFRFILLSTLWFIGEFLFSSPSMAISACMNNIRDDIKTDYIKKLAHKLRLKNIVFAACKSSPGHIGQTYAVLITRNDQLFCTYECRYNLVFLLADNSARKISNLYIGENALLLDARIINNITVDTGLYQLNPFLRAAGFRIEKKRPAHHAQPYTERLYLFIEKGRIFRPLFRSNSDRHYNKTLSALVMKITERHDRQGHTGSHACKLHRSESTRTIELGNYNNGLRNLIVRSRISDISGLKQKNGCHEEEFAITTGETVIAYDGANYRIPDWLCD